MRRLGYIIRKEFIQILRNKAILPLMTIVPIVQLILLTFAADSEVENVRLAIVDLDRSPASRLLIQKITYADRFIIEDLPASVRQADFMLQNDDADIVLTIPGQFEKHYLKTGQGQLQLLVNAINGQQATVGAAYLGTIIQGFNEELKLEVTRTVFPAQAAGPILKTEPAYWFNPNLNFKHFMAPGIMGELVTILVMLLTAMNIVREREIGTIEQINVTPIRKWEFILGKMIPFLIIGMILLAVGLSIGKILFDVPFRGNLIVVFAYCFVNLTAVLGLGLFISNISDTQQQAMLTTFFFVIIFILMSGLFTPIESMPEFAQYLTIPNPIAHFVHVMRSVLLKGSSVTDISYSFKVTALLSFIFNTLAVLSYRKVN